MSLAAAALAAAIAFKGVVLAAHTAKPVYGALVVVTQEKQDFTAVTLPDGSFEIGGLQRGEVAVFITSNEGGVSGSIELRLPVESRKLLVSDPRCSALSGKVCAADTGRPIPYASISAILYTESDDDGDYILDLGCPPAQGFQYHNTFFYTVWAPGYVTYSQMGGRAEGFHELLIRDFTLDPDRAVRHDSLRPPPTP